MTYGTPQGRLDGFHAALIVSVIAAALGVVVTGLRRRARAVPCPETA